MTYLSRCHDAINIYADGSNRAAFTGTRITLRQVSPESEDIYDFIVSLYKASNGDWKGLASKAGVSEQDLQHFLEYAAQFLGNCGNYKGFGDAKFIPRCPESAFAALASADPTAKKFYDATKGAIFSSGRQDLMHLGFTDDGHLTTYYPDSPTIKKEEIYAVKDWMESVKLLPENTRLRKTTVGDFELLIASAVTSVPEKGGDIGKETEFTIKDGPLAGKKITLVYGDYSAELKKIAECHRKAAEVAENENQKNMQLAYAESFETGSLEAFKNAQRYWIRDKGPMVESNIGFVETYRDPAGVRGEWEGFAATVNLERTRAFGGLVAAAEKEIPKLPWGKEFEKDKFLSPDFTSLEVLSFAGSGIPAGINIPNYDDIRQSEGFKNVSLGNVLSAKAPNEKIPFIAEEDLAIYQKYRDAAFEVQVGIHELLGHGTGKLLQETAPGVFNFDKENPPVSPVTNKPVETYYKPGQTWGSVFGPIAASYEECRAECVAMALSCEFNILKIFGFGSGEVDMDGEAGDVLYAAYLQMARAGVASLELWDPKGRKWGQAHSQARFSILKCFLEAGDDFAKLDYKNDDLSDLVVRIDRSKILTTGRKAVEEYLQKLHVYKSTADVAKGTELYERMTHVEPAFWGQKVREQVLRQKQPRKVFVQANTVLEGGKVVLREYEPSLEGIVASYGERDV
jgi:dipeptidyl-peptidase-3